MSKLPESGEPWTLTQWQWDAVTAALKIAAEHADDAQKTEKPNVA